MRIQNNLNAINSLRQLSVNNTQVGKNLEKLSSGFKINRAGDDAAGLAISEKMRSQIRGLEQATANAQDGISLLQTAEGGLNETHAILQRMNELATKAANGNLQAEDRTAINDELTQLKSEIDRIAKSTNFNGRNLLDGKFGVQVDATSTLKVGSDNITGIDISGAKASMTYTLVGADDASGDYTLTDEDGNTQVVNLADETAGVLNFDKMGVKISVNANNTDALTGTIKTTADAAVHIQIGAGTSLEERLGLQIGNMDTTALGIDGISVADDTVSRAAMDSIKLAINTVSAERSKLGANQNRLEHTVNNLGVTQENLTAAESRIRDVDMAKEMMEFTKNNILSQAAQAMLAQANQQPQGVLQLLQ